MCGIAGFYLSETDTNGYLAPELFYALGSGIEHRGTHATGIAFNARDPKIIKKDQKVSKFFSNKTTARIPTYLRSGIIHTRHATQGLPSKNENNHPIRYNHIVGIHNGCIDNDKDLFKKYNLKPNAEVDSEAIFAALSTADTPNDFGNILENVEGSMAIAFYRDGHLWLARGSSSPIMIGVTATGSMVFASESQAIQTAAEFVGMTIETYYEMDEGSIVRADEFAGGKITYHSQFTPDHGYFRSWSSFDLKDLETSKKKSDDQKYYDYWDKFDDDLSWNGREYESGSYDRSPYDELDLDQEFSHKLQDCYDRGVDEGIEIGFLEGWECAKERAVKSMILIMNSLNTNDRDKFIKAFVDAMEVKK